MVSDKTVAALRRASDSGIALTIATGRILNGATRILERAGAPGWVVSSGGGAVWDGNRVVKTHAMPPSQVKDLLQIAERTDLHALLFGAERIFFDFEGAHPGVATIVRNSSAAHTVLPLTELHDAQITKVSLAGAEENVDAAMRLLLDRYPLTVRSHALFVDVPLEGASKWEGITYALEQRGLDRMHALGVGDSDNDVDWLSNVGYPIAVAHASPSVKEVCRWQLPEIDDPVAALLGAHLNR